MPSQQTQVYLIKPLTNLHVGSGENNYGIVDRLVKRDPVSNAPVIHTSGIKGAIRQYFNDHGKAGINDLFGSPPQADRKDVQQGDLRFISADLLSIPAPSDQANGAPFVRYCNQGELDRWMSKVKAFKPDFTYQAPDDWVADEVEFKATYEELPVIARNYLDNGKSENLWYEEVVPRESVFGFVVMGSETAIIQLEAAISGKVVQLGANATVGYGYCKFEKIA